MRSHFQTSTGQCYQNLPEASFGRGKSCNRFCAREKIYPKHHLGGGKAAIGFVPGRTLVSMVADTDKPHRVIMGGGCLHIFSTVFD